MTSTTFLRRSGPVLASTAAAAALALVPASGAHAQVKAEFLGGGSADAHFVGSGGGDCNLSSAPGSDSVTTTPVIFGNGTKHAKVSLDATFTNSLNPSDSVRVKGSASTTLTLKRVHHNLSSFDLATGGTITVSHSLAPSQCSATAELGGGIEEALFTESKKGYLYLTRDTKKNNALTICIVIDVKTDKPVSEEVYSGGQSHATSRALLKPGKYALEETEVAITAGGGSIPLRTGAPRTSKVVQTVHLSGQFKPLTHHHH